MRLVKENRDAYDVLDIHFVICFAKTPLFAEGFCIVLEEAPKSSQVLVIHCETAIVYVLWSAFELQTRSSSVEQG